MRKERLRAFPFFPAVVEKFQPIDFRLRRADSQQEDFHYDSALSEQRQAFFMITSMWIQLVFPDF